MLILKQVCSQLTGCLLALVPTSTQEWSPTYPGKHLKSSRQDLITLSSSPITSAPGTGDHATCRQPDGVPHSPCQTQASSPQMPGADSAGQHSQRWWMTSLGSFNAPHIPRLTSAPSASVLLCTLTSTPRLLILLGSPHLFVTPCLPASHTTFSSRRPQAPSPAVQAKIVEPRAVPPFPRLLASLYLH